MAERYRLVIIGAGPAGLAAATVAARLGVSVALVERHRIGGDCTWTGCVPSKALLHVAAVAQTVRTAPAVGVHVSRPVVDFAASIEAVRRAIARVYQHETPEALARQGITVLTGDARFLDPRTLDVGGRAVTGDRILIATGARPALPPLDGLATTPYLTYETVFDQTMLPRRLIIIGAGPIGCELAQAFQRLGAAVTLVDRSDRVLSRADPEASALLGDALAQEGVTLRLGSAPRRVTAVGATIRVEVAGATLVGDALLIATGRQPALATLELDRAGVTWTPQGIRVDADLRTSQAHIYACGDAIGSFQFTHYASWQAVIAVRNALLPGASRGRCSAVPWTIFTDPEIAQVGLDERQARVQLGDQVCVTRWPIDRIDRAVTEGETAGFLKVLHRPDGRLLGATLVCRQAGELAQELSVALANRLTVRDLARAIHVYPTHGFALQQAAADALLQSFACGRRGALVRFLARCWPWT